MERLTSGHEDLSVPQSSAALLLDPEPRIVDSIIHTAHAAGLQVDPVSITNIYVGLKSKPLSLLVGPAGTGKIAMVQVLAKTLLGDDPLRCQMMPGHSWWANQSLDTMRFTEAQNSWNSGKIIDLIQEANQPENAQRIYLACLTRISPAELNEFFSEVAYQLRHDEVMRVSSAHLTAPIPFPKNLFLVGTMDVSQFMWLDEDLLSRTSLLHWFPEPSPSTGQSPVDETLVFSEKTFLRSCLRDPQAAFHKFYTLLKNQRHALFPVFEAVRVMREHQAAVPDFVSHSAIVYIANSWSSKGTGLFCRETTANLNAALDQAITQTILLPFGDRLASSAALRKDLLSVFREQFPRSSAFVGRLG